MSLIIPQAINDQVTYKFNVGGLGVNIISNISVTSTSLLISNVTNNSTSILFKVDSTGVKGPLDVNIVMTLSNGDVENKCIKFVIGTICI